MSGVDLVRGQTDIPLSGPGRSIAHEMGIQFCRRGGLDCIKSSSLHRCIETARIINAHNPKAKYKDITGSITTLGLAGLEGRLKDPTVSRYIDELIKDHPNRLPPALSPDQRKSGFAPGETFNHFKGRVLPWVQTGMAKHLMSPHKEAWVTHHRVIQLIRAWINMGCPPNFEVDIPEVLKKSGIDNPGQVERLFCDNGKWRMESENMKSLSKLKDSIYPTRHSFTVWNSGSTLGAS